MTVAVDPQSSTSPVERKIRISNVLVATSTLDVQVSINPRFEFCVCPIFNLAYQSGGIYNLLGLNGDTTYYVRARERLVNGIVDEWSAPSAFTQVADGSRATAPASVMIEPAMLVVPQQITSFYDANDLTAFPVTNLLRDDLTAYRTTQRYAGGFYFNFEVGSNPIDTIALLNTNLPETATWYVNGGGVPIVDPSDIRYTSDTKQFRASPALPGRPGYHGIIQLPTPQKFRWWRIVIDNAPLNGNLLSAQHLVVGRNRVSKNHALEKIESAAPLTSIERTRSGIADRVRGLPMRKVEFELQMLTEARYELIYGDLWRYENEPVLCVPNTKRGAFYHDRILFGDLTGGRTVNPASPRYNRGFTINSII